RAIDLATDVFDAERSPELADIHVRLGQCLLDLGRTEQAQASLAQANAIHARHELLGEQYVEPLHALQACLSSAPRSEAPQMVTMCCDRPMPPGGGLSP